MNRGKVDWIEAEALYLSDASTSYASLASKYGVATSTILRHAAKHDWRTKRKKQAIKLVEKTIKDREREREVIDKRHIAILQDTQTILMSNFVRLQQRSKNTGKIYASEMYQLTRAIVATMEEERNILGLVNIPKARQSIEDLHGEVASLPTIQINDITGVSIKERRKRLEKLSDRTSS